MSACPRLSNRPRTCPSGPHSYGVDTDASRLRIECLGLLLALVLVLTTSTVAAAL